MNIKSKSTQEVACCMVKESCVLKVPVGNLWERIKEFKWEKLLPSSIKSVKFDCGNPLEIGSQYTMIMNDGSSCTCRIEEISEIKRRFTVDMIDCEPKQKFTSMLSSWRMEKVTDDNSTYFCWETLYSNDVTQDILKSRKEQILSYFKDLKKLESLDKK